VYENVFRKVAEEGVPSREELLRRCKAKRLEYR